MSDGGRTRRRVPHVDMTVGPGLEADNRRFGELLEQLRWKAGLTRAEAAARLGLSSEYLRLIEAGRRTPALGQMQHFLSLYGADAEIERVMPGGDQPDLIMLDPLKQEPIIVEFKSRIREARRSSLGGPSEGGEAASQRGPDQDEPSVRRSAEIGAVVSLLTQADDSTIRRVRKLLEAELA